MWYNGSLITGEWHNMNAEEFERLYLGVFEPNERDIKLLQRVEEYFRATYGTDIHSDLDEINALDTWCEDHRYTREELIQAKKTVGTYLP